MAQTGRFPNLTWVNANTSNFDLKTAAPGDEFAKPVLSYPELKSYCAAGATDYTWAANGSRAYVNNTCVPYYTAPELVERAYSSVWLYTYWQQRHYSRLCVDANDVPKYFIPDPPGFPVAPDADKVLDFSDPGYVPNCGNVTLEAQHSVLAVAPEHTLNLTVLGTYTTSWGRIRTAMATRVGPRANVVPLPNADTGLPTEDMYFSATEDVTLPFATMLAMAGIDLDAPNVLTDGGQGPEQGVAWPRFRVTGVSIMALLSYGNFVENTTLPAWPDPFNFADHLHIELYPATLGTFASPGTKLYFRGHAYNYRTQAGVNDSYPWPESLFMTRDPQGVQVYFIGGGYIGKFNGTVLLGALVTIIILSNFAQSITDITAGFMIDGFRAQKYMDDLELRIRLMLRSQLADSPVPEQVRMFEQETLELYANRMYAASQRVRMAEMEAKAAAEAAATGGPPVEARPEAAAA